MKVTLATGNPHKVQEFCAMLAPMGIEVIAAPHDFAVDEDGLSFADNALKKARALIPHVRTPVLADDSGLEVSTLGNAPGILSARFHACCANAPLMDPTIEMDIMAANRACVLQALMGLPKAKRTARLICSLAFVRDCDDVGQVFEGALSGRIAYHEMGEHGFGYDAIFIPKGHHKTLATLDAHAKNGMSHRHVALTHFLQAYPKTLGKT